MFLHAWVHIILRSLITRLGSHTDRISYVVITRVGSHTDRISYVISQVWNLTKDLLRRFVISQKRLIKISQIFRSPLFLSNCFLSTRGKKAAKTINLNLNLHLHLQVHLHRSHNYPVLSPFTAGHGIGATSLPTCKRQCAKKALLPKNLLPLAAADSSKKV